MLAANSSSVCWQRAGEHAAHMPCARRRPTTCIRRLSLSSGRRSPWCPPTCIAWGRTSGERARRVLRGHLFRRVSVAAVYAWASSGSGPQPAGRAASAAVLPTLPAAAARRRRSQRAPRRTPPGDTHAHAARLSRTLCPGGGGAGRVAAAGRPGAAPVQHRHRAAVPVSGGGSASVRRVALSSSSSSSSLQEGTADVRSSSHAIAGNPASLPSPLASTPRARREGRRQSGVG